MALYEVENPPTEKNPPAKGEKKSKRSYTTGMSVASAMQALKDLGIADNPNEAYRFLKKHSPAALGLATLDASKWQRLQKSADYKPPILEDEIKSYQDYKTKSDALRSKSDASDFVNYLSKSGYSVNPRYKPSKVPQSGQFIIDNAKAKGAKIQENEDGTFTVFDDETTFRDSDTQYGKGRIIHPQAKYSATQYLRGKDLANVYNLAEPPSYAGRVPTEEELQAYKEGNLNMIALDPQYKPYYASAYFDPAKQEGNDRTLFYGGNTNFEDTDRYREFKALQERLAPVHERKIRMRKIMDKFIPKYNSGEPWSEKLKATGALLALPVFAGASLTNPLGLIAGSALAASLPSMGEKIGEKIDHSRPIFKRTKKL